MPSILAPNRRFDPSAPPWKPGAPADLELATVLDGSETRWGWVGMDINLAGTGVISVSMEASSIY